MCIRDRYYHACEIAGDIDFIFGGADALFEHCTLRTVDNGLALNSRVVMPLQESTCGTSSVRRQMCPTDVYKRQVLAPGRRVETLAAYAGGCVSGVLCVQPPGNAFGLLFLSLIHI